MMAGQIVENVGAISSTVFILQVALQVKLYGLKCWLNLGLGTGTPVADAKKDEKRIERAGEDVLKGVEDVGKDAVKDMREIEDWL